MKLSPNDKWRAIAARKQGQRESRIPAEWRLKTKPPPSQTCLLDVPRTCGLLTEEELRITEVGDATALLGELHSDRVKAVDVATAFCKRAAVAQQMTNCLTEIFFDRALSRAAELDAYFAKHKKPIGPLHGLPISLKDTFKIKGLDASIGIASLCFKPADTNSVLVDVLLSAGAILYCKTNIPQTLMALDSHNNVFGRTINPANTALTPGGSSGGEGALVAMRGSILGIGTDVGGSVRIPAMCNGLVGLKPSHGRVPYAGQEGGAPAGQEKMGVHASAGPIARSVRDCELLMRVVAWARSWEVDPEVVRLGWSPTVRRGKLRVGVIRTDGVTTPLPPIRGFLDETVKRLAKSGEVEVVELEVTGLMKQAASLINKLFSVDGGNAMFDLLEETREPLSPWLQGRLKRRPRYSIEATRELHGRRTQLQAEFLKVWRRDGRYWRGGEGGQHHDKLDIIIAPVAPHPVPEVDRWNTAAYTASFVLMDYAAGTLPVRDMDEGDLTGETEKGEPLSGWDAYNKKLWDEVDRKVYLGSPLCLQILGARLAEEQVIEGMSVLERVLGRPGKKDQRAKL